MRDSRREARGGRPVWAGEPPTTTPDPVVPDPVIPDVPASVDDAAERATDALDSLPSAANVPEFVSSIVGGSGAGATGGAASGPSVAQQAAIAAANAPSRVAVFLRELFRSLAERFDNE